MLESLLLSGSMPKDPLQLVKYALRAANHLEKQKPVVFPDALIDGGKPAPCIAVTPPPGRALAAGAAVKDDRRCGQILSEVR